MNACSVADCQNTGRLTRGMCPKHYTRWRRHGDPLKVVRYVEPSEIEAGFWRFAQPNQHTACWRWLGVMGGNGRPYLGRSLAYRVAYELHYGPIPDGLEIDHLCGNGQCVNPGHLEPVSSQENKRRLYALLPEVCRKGHPRKVGERCAECDAEKHRRLGHERAAAIRLAAAMLGLGWKQYVDRYGTAKSTAVRVLQESA